MEDFANETSDWLETRMADTPVVECELGSLIAAASAWTEDETELDDLVGGLLESGQIELSVG